MTATSAGGGKGFLVRLLGVVCDSTSVPLTCGQSMFGGISPAGGGMFEDGTRSGVRKRGGGKGQDRRRAAFPTSVRHIDAGSVFRGLR